MYWNPTPQHGTCPSCGRCRCCGKQDAAPNTWLGPNPCEYLVYDQKLFKQKMQELVNESLKRDVTPSEKNDGGRAKDRDPV